LVGYRQAAGNQYETVIGLEVHVQLQTRSKMFCPCGADYQTAPPNSRVCPVCLGLPGTLPVINRRAVEFTIMTGLALHCRIPEHSKFDRKNYPYPDLMKGYQISQYDLPLAVEGYLEIEAEGQVKRIGVTRVHLEEDVAKLQHLSSAEAPGGEACSLVDVNRSGVPLMEVVGEPDLRSPEEARAYLVALHSLVQYLGVSTGNMQDGSFRCDANVSIRPRGAAQFGTRTEVKNMNSFHSVFMALNYEVERQRRVLEDGGRVVQETRGWVEERGVTVSQRSKEQAHDYRYFPEPDLPPLVISPQWVEELRRRLPELPAQRKARLVREYGIPEYDAGILTGARPMADYFERAAALKPAGATAAFAKQVSNWMLGDLSRLMNLAGQDITQVKATPAHLAELIGLIEAGVLSTSLAKTVLEEVFQSGQRPGGIVKDRGYTQISDAGLVEAAVAQAIDANPKAVADYRSGKEMAARFLVGQVMKLTKGQAKPELVNELVRRRLAGS
jgi:aspartyl-tRNA(Asn)/glutamyl-tRNA(Gln) amidotransferase subunit B